MKIFILRELKIEKNLFIIISNFVYSWWGAGEEREAKAEWRVRTIGSRPTERFEVKQGWLVSLSYITPPLLQVLLVFSFVLSLHNTSTEPCVDNAESTSCTSVVQSLFLQILLHLCFEKQLHIASIFFLLFWQLLIKDNSNFSRLANKVFSLIVSHRFCYGVTV